MGVETLRLYYDASFTRGYCISYTASGGGIPTNLFSESRTLKVYHSFIKTFHGFVLGRVSTSPPKSCLAVPKVVEYTVTQVNDDIVKGRLDVLLRFQKVCSEILRWSLFDSICIEFLLITGPRPLGTVTVNFVFEKMPTLSDSIHSHPSPLPRGWCNDPKDGWGDSRTPGGWSRDGQGQ